MEGRFHQVHYILDYSNPNGSAKRVICLRIGLAGEKEGTMGREGIGTFAPVRSSETSLRLFTYFSSFRWSPL